MRFSQSIKFDDKENIVSLTYYSIIYLTTADNFVQKAKELETSFSGIYDEEKAIELNGYVNSAILNTIAFLEALINESLHGLCEKDSSWFQNIKPEIKTNFRNLGELNIPHKHSYNTIEKYEFVIKIINESKFDKGKKPYQDVVLLIQLRNALIHYKPKWKNHVDNESDFDEFYQKLSYKFEPNPFFSTDPYFPFKCLGHGCAEWALKSAIEFTDLFYKIIDVKPIYIYRKPELKIINNA